jgi:hypothetical protein
MPSFHPKLIFILKIQLNIITSESKVKKKKAYLYSKQLLSSSGKDLE